MIYTIWYTCFEENLFKIINVTTLTIIAVFDKGENLALLLRVTWSSASYRPD